MSGDIAALVKNPNYNAQRILVFFSENIIGPPHSIKDISKEFGIDIKETEKAINFLLKNGFICRKWWFGIIKFTLCKHQPESVTDFLAHNASYIHEDNKS